MPGFFLSSNNFCPALTSSPSLTNIVGFIPIKSLDNNATDELFGSSLKDALGAPDIGKSRPFDILITVCVPLKKLLLKLLKNNRIIRLKNLRF